MKSRSLVYFTAITAVILALLYKYFTTYDYVIVKTEEGLLRGVNATTWGGTSYFSFKGIRYAEAPVGELRFKAPVRSSAWLGVRDAVHHGAVCPHKDLVLTYLRGEEDCLFLNVYTPSLKDNKLPVMVWIHGGGFIIGSANDEAYGPDMFIDDGVVLVTLNYRLGALGFLNTDDGVIPGNAGLKDQNMALLWVQRNIANFGGDPEKVTLFGESAGGASVNFHILSPKSKGLFVRAITQSGSPLCPWALSNRGNEFAVNLAKYLGLKKSPTGAEILQHLQSVPFAEILYAQEAIRGSEEHRADLPFVFVPTVETNVDPAEAFISNFPLEIIKSGNYSKVPHIIGYNADEGLVMKEEYMDPKERETVVKNPEKFLPKDVKFSAKNKEKLAESMRNLYFPDRIVTDDNIHSLVNLYTDIAFVSPINRVVKLYLETSDQPIYRYVFDHEGRLNFMKLVFFIRLPGTSHADELGYLFHFKSLWFMKLAVGTRDEFVSRTMVRLWTNFAKFGKPAPEGDAVTWDPVTTNEFEYLKMTGDGFVMDKDPSPERSLFWQNAIEMSSS